MLTLLTRKGKSLKKVYFTVFLVFSLLIIVFSGLDSLFFTHQTKEWKAETLAIPPSYNIGLDYYHESMGYLSRTDTEIDSDLDRILSVTHKIKVYHNPFASTDPTGVDTLEVVKNIVRKAKARKMYVVWTENDDNVTLTDANWREYTKKVIADAAEAYSVGTDEFLVGNEISLHNNGNQGYNDINLPDHIKQLVSNCQKNFPGNKGYEEGWFKSESWHKATLGTLNKIYFTLYEPWHKFKDAFDQIVSYFGKKAEIGELSTMTTKSRLNDTEEEWARELMRKYDYARQKGIPIWLFAFRETQNDSFGLFQFAPSNQPHDIWNYLKGLKTFTYHIFFSNDFNDDTTQAFLGNGYNYKKRLRVNEFNAQAIADVSVSDYVFRGIASPVSTSGSQGWRAMRVVFRYSDLNNYYFVNIEPNDSRIKLFRRQDGTETFLGDVPTSLQFGTDYDFEIRVGGSGSATRIQVFWDTVKIIDVTDTRNISLNTGGVGIKNNGVVGDIDNIVVTDFEQVILTGGKNIMSTNTP